MVETPSSTLLNFYMEDDAAGTSRSHYDGDQTDSSSINMSGQLAQFLMKNLERMAVVHEKTELVLKAHNQQFKEVKKYVDEVGKANRNEVNRLKHEVNHFREQCNLRFNKLENPAVSGTAMGTSISTPTVHRNSAVAPTIDGPFTPFQFQPNIGATIIPATISSGRVLPVKKGKARTKSQRKKCPYCGSLLKKSYLWKHKKYHCSSAKEYSQGTS